MLSIKTIGRVGKRYRHLIRYQQIVGIIFKYGFENIIEASQKNKETSQREYSHQFWIIGQALNP